MAKTDIVKHHCTACAYNDDAIRIDGRILCPQCGCPDKIEDAPGIDEDELCEFIQNELLKDGIVVMKEDIMRVFELEQEFAVRQGLINMEDDLDA